MALALASIVIASDSGPHEAVAGVCALVGAAAGAGAGAEAIGDNDDDGGEDNGVGCGCIVAAEDTEGELVIDCIEGEAIARACVEGKERGEGDSEGETVIDSPC